jgi:hypothetical protein
MGDVRVLISCARCVFLYLISFVILDPEQLEKPNLNTKTEEQLKTKNKNKKIFKITVHYISLEYEIRSLDS